MKEASVYASIRQAKAKTGMSEELARRIKEGAIPIISVDRAESDALVGRASYSDGWARDRAHLGVTDAKWATCE